jgi:hypothetical protein
LKNDDEREAAEGEAVGEEGIESERKLSERT